MKKYYVDFYDMIDGWGELGFFTDRFFDDINEAINLCNTLNSELDESNKKCGEHYGVIDTTSKLEIYCGQERELMLMHRAKEGFFIPDTNEVRINKPSEKIELYAHSGECKYCKGIVKMFRDTTTAKLQPDNCQCLQYGQPYFVEIIGPIGTWEMEQWNQKFTM